MSLGDPLVRRRTASLPVQAAFPGIAHTAAAGESRRSLDTHAAIR